MKFIRENQEALKKAISNKGVDLNLDELLEIDEKRKKASQEVEELKSLKNDINDLMKEAKTDEEKKEILAKAKEIKEKLAKAEPAYKAVKNMFDLLIARVPNIPSPDTPVGKGDKDNKEIEKWGEIPKFNFQPKDHIQLGKELDILDIERGAKVAAIAAITLKTKERCWSRH